MDYINETKVFVEKLKLTKEYVDYQSHKNVIASNPQLLEKVNEYRKKSFDIHLKYGEDSFEGYENLSRLNHEYNELIEGPEVKQFLEAEQELSKVISVVYNCIAKEINLDISFL